MTAGLLVGLALLVTPVSAEDINSPAAWRPGYQEMARLGPGFVVWESNRTGHWRLWYINLDGSGQRRLTPEDGREHACPHISPDGKRIAYLSHAKAGDEVGALHLAGADGTDDRIVVPEARNYGGDRAVVWLNEDELLYIGADRITRRLDLRSGKNTPLLREAVEDQEWGVGWLMNPTLTHATTGVPTFSRFEAKAQNISPRTRQGGCEPYFSYDGAWGFWMGGAGGPINRINLATGEVTPILKLDDDRLPRERNYLYFPMLSRNGRLLAFAASPDQHDHDTSDYDIFVARTDPKTLEIIGKPVRYTFHKATDRYPDVFLADRPPIAAAKSLPKASPATPARRPGVTARRDGRAWPTDRDGLVFLWETGNKPNLVPDPATKKEKKERTYALRARALARMDHNYALVLAGGAYLAEGADEPLLTACRKTNELSIEATILPDKPGQGGPARIVTSSTDAGTRNFTLGQDGDRLILRLRTPETGENGTNPQVELCPLPAGRPTHVVVTYAPGRLVCYQDGNQVLTTDKIRGGFGNWTAQHLLFGDEWNGERNWAGTLEGVAIYNRALSADEARANYEAYHARRLARKAVPRFRVEARLVARSRIPTLKQIQPYRQALVICEYAVEKVEKVLNGGSSRPPMPKRVRVAQWALLDGANTDIGKTPQDEPVHLVLEPFDGNPQLESIFRSDTLPEDFDVPLFYDAAK